MTDASLLPRLHYHYRAFTQQGDIEIGTVDASSHEHAVEIIWSRGLTPLETTASGPATGEPWWKRDIVLGSDRPSPRALCDFTRALSTLIQAGIPLDDALRMVGDQTASGPMSRLCPALLASVLDGAPLSEALSQHRLVFQADYINIVRAGEAGSDIGLVLNELAALLERRQELSKAIKSALIYPTVLIVMAFVSIAVIISVLVPNIAPIFAQSGKAPPYFIGQIVALQSSWVEISLIFIGCLAALAGTAAALLRNPALRIAAHRGVTKLPLIGGVIVQQNVARFARTLGTLLRAGVPMVSAFGSALEVVGNHFLEAGFRSALEELRDGKSLARALSERAALPKAALQMIAIGEESGKLERMLIRLAESFEQQTQRHIDNAMTLLTPALTLVIAGLVGSLIFTVMSAILSINELAMQ